MNYKTVLFVSSLADYMYDFISYKRVQGYNYSDQEIQLSGFDRFLNKNNYLKDFITQEIICQYNHEKVHLKPASKANVFSSIRNFSKYLNMFKMNSYVLPAGSIKFSTQKRYYLYTKKEVCILIKAARSKKYMDAAMAHCLPFLIGLLYTTGLRINEALKLTVDDIDFQDNTLFINKGKFAKDRYVMLDSSVVSRLSRWLDIRKTFIHNKDETAVFIDAKGIPIKDYRIRKFFHGLIIKYHIGMNSGSAPRLHDIRHTYACACVNRWTERGDDVNAKLPVLSTAMGHVGISSTQIYLHITAANLHKAADRFHEKVFKNKLKRN